MVFDALEELGAPVIEVRDPEDDGDSMRLRACAKVHGPRDCRAVGEDDVGLEGREPASASGDEGVVAARSSVVRLACHRRGHTTGRRPRGVRVADEVARERRGKARGRPESAGQRRASKRIGRRDRYRRAYR